MLLRLAFALVIAAPASTLEVCGNYCGPGWCNGASMPECSNGGSSCEPSPANCVESGPTDGSGADACCKIHDSCCGSSDRTQCNNNLIACLKAVVSGPSCYYGIVPVPVDAILAAMELNPYGCCGSSCNGDDANASLVAAVEDPWCCSAGVAPESDCKGLGQHDCEFHLPQCAWGPCPPREALKDENASLEARFE